MTKRELARAAIRTIKKYGWIQRAYGNKSGGFCALGAILECSSSKRDNPSCKVQDALFETLNRLSGVDSFVIYNDTEGRTQKEVLALFRKAAR
jgi:hypothetical protein